VLTVGFYPFAPAAAAAGLGVLYLNSYGADPTGAAYSDTALDAALSALGSSAGAAILWAELWAS
jgi:hypothetical protein